MQGLELARAFYARCRPLLEERVPDIMAQAAVGLVGEGSECLGCDDAISRDHDFGAAFCLWLPERVLAVESPRLEAALSALPTEFDGVPSRLVPQRRGGRVGPLGIETFYGFFGVRSPALAVDEWLHIPEYHLCSCTNGAVFEDNLGEFSRWREALAAYYPRDVWLKKLAARCMQAAQAGQYNLPRALRRGDAVAAFLALGRFAEAALALVYLCNRRYMPFYKWAGLLAADLPTLGPEVCALVRQLAARPVQGAPVAEVCAPIEEFCTQVARHLGTVGLSDRPGNWLWEHGLAVHCHISDRELGAMDILRV